MPPLYQVTSKVISGPDIGEVEMQSSNRVQTIIDQERWRQVIGVRKTNPRPLFPSIPEGLLLEVKYLGPTG